MSGALPRGFFGSAYAWLLSERNGAAVARFALVCVLVALALRGLEAAGVGFDTPMGTGQKYFWFAAAAVFPALVAAAAGHRRVRAWWARLDRRIADMLWASLLADWLTLFGFWLGAHMAEHAVEEIFNGWVASVVFWALVGLVVAAVSVARAEEEHFPTRARILFGTQEGPHIDHMVGALSNTLGHYAEKISREITVAEYRPDPAGGRGWFRLELESETTLKAYVQDTETIYKSTASFTNTNQLPAGFPPARIVRADCLHPDNSRTPPSRIPRADGVDIEYTTRFRGPGSCVFSVHRVYWVREGEENVFELSRFARQLDVRVRNNSAELDPVWMQRIHPATPGPAPGRISLQRDEGWQIIPVRQDGKPDDLVHDFQLWVDRA
jgi:hypothetical protein